MSEKSDRSPGEWEGMSVGLRALWEKKREAEKALGDLKKRIGEEYERLAEAQWNVHKGTLVLDWHGRVCRVVRVDLLYSQSFAFKKDGRVPMPVIVVNTQNKNGEWGRREVRLFQWRDEVSDEA